MLAFEPDSCRKSPGLQLRRRGQIPIAPAAPLPHYLPPRFRALALFGRRPAERVHGPVMPASENLHKSGCEQSQQGSSLFDHLVGALLQQPRHVDAQRLGGLEIDHQLELDRELHRKLARSLAFENSVGVGSGASVVVGNVVSVRQQPAASVKARKK